MAVVQIHRTGKIARIAHTALLISAASLLATLTVGLLTLYPIIHSTLLKSDALVDETARTVLDAKTLVRSAQSAENLQTTYLREWDGKVSATFDNADVAIASIGEAANRVGADADSVAGASVQTMHSADTTLAASTQDLRSLNASIAGLQPVETSATASLQDLDALLKSPDVAETAKNADVVSGNLAKISGDFQTRFHDVLFPPPCATKLCTFARIWPMIRDASEMIEPVYYGAALAREASMGVHLPATRPRAQPTAPHPAPIVVPRPRPILNGAETSQ